MALLSPRLSALLATLAALALPAAAADPPPAVQAEIDFLLGAIDSSGCRFLRNGDWHTAHEAQKHLRDKYDALVARGLVDTTEQFIDRAATQSSFSGQFYMLSCDGGPTLSSRQWLREQLARHRGNP